MSGRGLMRCEGGDEPGPPGGTLIGNSCAADALDAAADTLAVIADDVNPVRWLRARAAFIRDGRMRSAKANSDIERPTAFESGGRPEWVNSVDEEDDRA